MDRRHFMRTGGLMAAGTVSFPRVTLTRADKAKLKQLRSSVNFIWDGLALSPLEYSDLLMQLADKGKIRMDYYSNGGIVEELENKFAQWLGKESAVFMPTGTLANHIALRKLAGGSRRVIVQANSHIYNDSGDCAQTLSNLNLIPLGKNKVCFSLDDVVRTIEQTQGGRVATGIGAVSIESPVRRNVDRISSYNEMKVITAYAKEIGIGLHMDGARLFVQSTHTGISPAEYGELFDTVYTSLYKCFNAASGAILAGPKKITEGLFHMRRMFGGGLPCVWPFAAVALQYVDTFIDDYSSAYSKAQKFFAILEQDERFKIKKFEDGTHIVQLIIKGGNFQKLKTGLSKKNVQLRSPNKEGFLLKINPSMNRMKPERLAGYFIDSL
ncbi:threonine aldolase family protein [bacterium]